LDAWLEKGRVEVEGERMTLQPNGQKFQLKTGLLFVEELAGGGDELQLVGKVKDIEQVVELGGEHAYDSVVLGDNAYTVVEGFLGEPLFDEAAQPAQAVQTTADVVGGDSLAAAAAAAVGEGKSADQGELDLLARFFLSSS
ncbi:MAG: hypothetical protein JRH11_06735, partial [Deltaproteobacteria bacterium]|nr:hypothetical protein [Deltaproteobacteria bacterium]